MRTGHEKSFQKQMAHVHADENATITSSILLGRVSQVLPGKRASEELAELCGDVSGLIVVSIYQRVIVECNSINDGDQQ